MTIVRKTATSITIITEKRTIHIDTTKRRRRRPKSSASSPSKDEHTTAAGKMVSITDFPQPITTGNFPPNNNNNNNNNNNDGNENNWTPLSYFNPLNAMMFYSGNAAGAPQQQQYQEQQHILNANAPCYVPGGAFYGAENFYPPFPPPPAYTPFPFPPPPMLQPPIAPPTTQMEVYEVDYRLPKFPSVPVPNVDPLRTLQQTIPSPVLNSSAGGLVKRAPPGLAIPSELSESYRHQYNWDGKGYNPFGPIRPPKRSKPLRWRRWVPLLGSRDLIDPDDDLDCKPLDEMVTLEGTTVVRVPLFEGGVGFNWKVLQPSRRGRTWTCCRCCTVHDFNEGNVCGQDCHVFCNGGCLAYVEEGREEEFIVWREYGEMPLPEYEEVEVVQSEGVVVTVGEVGVEEEISPVQEEESSVVIEGQVEVSPATSEEVKATTGGLETITALEEKYRNSKDDNSGSGEESEYETCISSNSTDSEDNDDGEEVFSNVSQSPPDSKATSLHSGNSDEEETVVLLDADEEEAEPEWMDDSACGGELQFRFEEEVDGDGCVVGGEGKGLHELIRMQLLVHRWRCSGGSGGNDAEDGGDEGCGSVGSNRTRRKRRT